MTRGRCGWLALHRMALSSTTPRRFSPAHEEHDLVHGICANGVYLAWATVLMGHRARGLEYLDRGLERPAGAVLQWTRFGTVTAAAYLVAERPNDAQRIIAQGLAAVAERDARGYRPSLLRLEAEVLLYDGEAATAAQRGQEALALAVELKTSPDIAQCHAILAKITGRLGDSAAAKAHLGVAQRIFEQLGSTFWASRTANE